MKKYRSKNEPLVVSFSKLVHKIQKSTKEIFGYPEQRLKRVSFWRGETKGNTTIMRKAETQHKLSGHSQCFKITLKNVLK